MKLWLGIKTKFLIKIISGEKTIEYRPYSDYYKKKFDNNKYEYVVFHQYRGPLLIKKIKKIKLINTPKFIESFDSKKCYAIHLE